MAGTTIYYNRGTNDIPSLEIVIDPTDEFKETRVEALFDALGLLPEWFLNSGRHPQLVPVTLWDAMRNGRPIRPRRRLVRHDK
jgi:hypothetical protein